jgi:diketogulonate reductase-like aldo/keto reductase
MKLSSLTKHQTLSQEESAMNYKTLYNGEKIPVIGQGTWGLGGGMTRDDSLDEMALQAIRNAIELGYTHIDTAEMYGRGHAEELVGQVIGDFKREELFITSKVWKITMYYKNTLRALESSLLRLGTDYLDLYLIHRPNREIPLDETFRALNQLVEQGKVKYLGVSNFNLEQLKRAQVLADTPLVTNQVPYNLHKRTYVDNGVLEYCQENNILLTAYSPIDRGYLLEDPKVKEIAEKYAARPSQVALNWLILQPKVIALPMSTKREHLQENLGALDLELSQEDIQKLDQIEFPEEVLWPE